MFDAEGGLCPSGVGEVAAEGSVDCAAKGGVMLVEKLARDLIAV